MEDVRILLLIYIPNRQINIPVAVLVFIIEVKLSSHFPSTLAITFSE